MTVYIDDQQLIHFASQAITLSASKQRVLEYERLANAPKHAYTHPHHTHTHAHPHAHTHTHTHTQTLSSSSQCLSLFFKLSLLLLTGISLHVVYEALRAAILPFDVPLSFRKTKACKVLFMRTMHYYSSQLEARDFRSECEKGYILFQKLNYALF